MKLLKQKEKLIINQQISKQNLELEQEQGLKYINAKNEEQKIFHLDRNNTRYNNDPKPQKKLKQNDNLQNTISLDKNLNIDIKNQKKNKIQKNQQVVNQQFFQQLCQIQNKIQEPILHQNQQNQLNYQKSCYICKVKFFKLHHFYDQMCLQCAELNFQKRNQKADFSNKIALLTGGRVKIGFQIALILLRNNIQKLIITSRFPKDTLIRFSQESDFNEFKSKILIYGLDFRNLQSIKQFCDYLYNKQPRLDILINNAAQTIRRHPVYYQNILVSEQYTDQQLMEKCNLKINELNEILPQDFDFDQKLKKDLIKNFTQPYQEIQSQKPQKQQKVFNIQTDISTYQIKPNENNNYIDNNELTTKKYEQLFQNINYSALASQVPTLEQDFSLTPQMKNITFPPQNFDINNQQIDLSFQNSWISNIETVNFMEFAESQIINQWAPYLLIQNLLPLFQKQEIQNTQNNQNFQQKSCQNNQNNQNKQNIKFIQNVTSMEGIFNKTHKSPNHPHTNMAKAALNMLTKTSGPQLAQKYNIYMNAFDTGWVSEMKPNSQNISQTVPLDEIDGAMRVLDNIFEYLLTGKIEHSKFYKDYKVSNW